MLLMSTTLSFGQEYGNAIVGFDIVNEKISDVDKTLKAMGFSLIPEDGDFKYLKKYTRIEDNVHYNLEVYVTNFSDRVYTYYSEGIVSDKEVSILAHTILKKSLIDLIGKPYSSYNYTDDKTLDYNFKDGLKYYIFNKTVWENDDEVISMELHKYSDNEYHLVIDYIYKIF